MKTITCNLCGKPVTKYERFKIKVTSPFLDISNMTAHCCEDCFDNLYDFLFSKRLKEADNDKTN